MDIDIEDLLPEVRRTVLDRRSLQWISRIVEQDVETSGKGDELIDHAMGSVFIGQIARQQNTPASDGFHCGERLLRPIHTGVVVNPHHRSCLGKSLSSGSTDPHPCTRDESGSASEIKRSANERVRHEFACRECKVWFGQSHQGVCIPDRPSRVTRGWCSISGAAELQSPKDHDSLAAMPDSG